MSSQKILDIIVPVYNEEEILQEFHHRLMSLNLDLNVVYIDNCSTDRSVEIIESFESVTLVKHEKNEGYGGSIIDGIAHSSHDKIIIIDADCEYPPEALPELAARLDQVAVVYTSRFLAANNNFMPRLKRYGNQLISALFNRLFHQQVTDLYTGCKGFKRSALDGITLERKGFEHVLELAVKFARKDYQIHEISIDFTPRHTGEAKMKHLSETLKYLYLTIYYYFTQR